MEPKMRSRAGVRKSLIVLGIVLGALIAGYATLSSPKPAAAAPNMIFPFPDGQTWKISCGYAPCHPDDKWNRYALDFVATSGSTLGQPVRAVADGTVTFGGCSADDLVNGKCTGKKNWGLHVRVDHGGGYSSVYAHLSSMAKSSGAVKQGQVIGYAGCTGLCGGPHVHFVLFKDGTSVRPEPMCGRTGFATGQLHTNCGGGSSGGGSPASSGGDHFYTTSVSEPANAAASGYRWEGIAAYLSPGPVSGWVPLYRLWSTSGSDHFYTTSAGERDSAAANGYVYEGMAGYVSTAPSTSLVPLYRLWSSSGSDHFYTTSVGERDSAAANGYVYEGVAGYVSASAASGLVPFFRWWLP